MWTKEDLDEFIRLNSYQMASPHVNEILRTIPETFLYEYMLDTSSLNITFISNSLGSSFIRRTNDYYTPDQYEKHMAIINKSCSEISKEHQEVMDMMYPLYIKIVEKDFTDYCDMLFELLKTCEKPVLIIGTLNSMDPHYILKYISDVCINKATLALVHIERKDLRLIDQIPNVKKFLKRRKELKKQGYHNINAKLVEMALAKLC